MRADTIGSDFGFPRLGIKKKYKWKKMNFTTELPKRNPVVSYIVASAIKCDKFFPQPTKNRDPIYRMHAVILKNKSLISKFDQVKQKSSTSHELYIVCHIRKVEVV